MLNRLAAKFLRISEARAKYGRGRHRPENIRAQLHPQAQPSRSRVNIMGFRGDPVMWHINFDEGTATPVRHARSEGHARADDPVGAVSVS